MLKLTYNNIMCIVVLEIKTKNICLNLINNSTHHPLVDHTLI